MASKSEVEGVIRDEGELSKGKEREKCKTQMDEVISEKESDKSEDDEPEPEKCKTQKGDATPDTKLDVGDTYSNWSSEQDGLCEPNELCVANLPPNATRNQVMDFFGRKPVKALLFKIRDKEKKDVFVESRSLVVFSSPSDTKEALKLGGKLFRGRPLYITPQGNNCAMVCASGLSKQMSVEDTKVYLRKKFEPYATVLHIYLPQISSASLGFAYIYLRMKNDLVTDEVLMSVGDDDIGVREATARQCFYPEMEGRTVLQDSKDPKTALKKEHFPIETNVKSTLSTFCWTETREDIIQDPYKQEENNCWSVALSRAYNTLLALTGSDKPKLTPDELASLVDPSSIVSGRGISSLKCAQSAMQYLVKEMNVFRRPRGGNIAKHEEFEQLIKALLKTSPVMVAIDLLPDYIHSFSGDGVYVPSEADFYMRTYEKCPIHCLLLTGYGVENGVEYWKLQDSNGAEWGSGGFIKVACHKCLVRSVVQLKL